MNSSVYMIGNQFYIRSHFNKACNEEHAAGASARCCCNLQISLWDEKLLKMLLIISKLCREFNK